MRTRTPRRGKGQRTSRIEDWVGGWRLNVGQVVEVDPLVAVVVEANALLREQVVKAAGNARPPFRPALGTRPVALVTVGRQRGGDLRPTAQNGKIRREKKGGGEALEYTLETCLPTMCLQSSHPNHVTTNLMPESREEPALLSATSRMLLNSSKSDARRVDVFVLNVNPAERGGGINSMLGRRG